MQEKAVSGARKRYDEKHPVISIRVSAEEYDRLKAVLSKQNKSFGDFLRESLNIEERNYREARKGGYSKGYKDARERYAIRLYCATCYDPIIITDPRLRVIIADSYNKLALHADCDMPEDLDPDCIVVLGREGDVRKA